MYYMNNYFNSNEEFDGDKSKIITFEKLDELGIINGFNDNYLEVSLKKGKETNKKPLTF